MKLSLCCSNRISARLLSKRSHTSRSAVRPIETGDVNHWQFAEANPRNWQRRKKWAATLVACWMSCLVSIAASAYSQAVDQLQVEFEASYLLAVGGISLFTIAVAICPIVFAPLGESFGRQRVYLISYGMFFLFFLPTALAKNMTTVLVSRFLNGAAGSIGSTMVGGTVADLWDKKERQIPMSLFALSALLGTPLGEVAFTWAGGGISWRWIFWTLLSLVGPSVCAIALFFREETFPRQSRLQIEAANAEQKSRLGTSLRPLYFLATEPISLALSVWIAFAWATLYLFLEAIPLIFAPYGFTHANMTRGASFVGISIGSLVGFGAHLTILHARKPVSTPERRLPEACFGALLFAGGFFILAWTAKPGQIAWIVPQLGAATIMAGLFMVYICIFDYLADCYGSYASSAIAAQSFLRNTLATVFPLVAKKMYTTLTYSCASTLLGGIAIVLAFVPLLLLAYGKQLRARSPFASNQFGQ